ncbi:MAG: tetratricopeptide repeat protein [Cyanobacteria bacterium P01_G01_bin.67]
MKNGKPEIFILVLTAVSWLSVQLATLAQNQPANPNPLAAEINPSDPVIPAGYGQRELSPFETYRIEKTIAELDQSAKAELAQGNQDRAFELWYRQLKLIRAIDQKAEIEALGTIGTIAWQSNRGLDLRNIAERLITLETEINSDQPLSLDLLKKLSHAYQQVRYLEQAIKIQTRINQVSRRQDNYNLAVEQTNLEALGELYLAKFDYQNAAKIYQKLLSLNDSAPSQSSNKPQTGQYLKTLIDIYDPTAQTNQAIATKKLLVEHYAATGQSNQIPELEIAIARDYETLNQIPQAISAYNQTWKMASQTQQLAIADLALTRLGELHQEAEQIDLAIAAYSNLIRIQQQSYNYYGLINTYDTLGQIYLKSNQKAKAQESFQEALKLAQSLNYKTDYFNNQIKQIKE